MKSDDPDTGLKVWQIKAIHDVPACSCSKICDIRAPGYQRVQPLPILMFPAGIMTSSYTILRLEIAGCWKSFTLHSHELGHLLLHTSGVDTRSGSVTPSMPVRINDAIEVLCNSLRGPVLVPDDVFRDESFVKPRSLTGDPLCNIWQRRGFKRGHGSTEKLSIAKFLDRPLRITANVTRYEPPPNGTRHSASRAATSDGRR